MWKEKGINIKLKSDMIQTVIKRDGRIVGFNEEKIATAIRKAMLHTEIGEDRELIRQITDHISFKVRHANDCRIHSGCPSNWN